MDTNKQITRRCFVGATSMLAIAHACSDGTSSEAGPTGNASVGSGAGGGGTNNAEPVWKMIPTITFVHGIASSFSIADYVSDPDGDELAITMNLDEVALPAGVTYDAVGKQLVYDGSGPLVASSGHVLTADDGQP